MVNLVSAQDGVIVALSARTDVGMRRSGNEDNFLVADLTSGRHGLVPEVKHHRLGLQGSLLVVSDGMGGAAAGEVASSMAVQIVFEEMHRNFRPGLPVADVLRRASEEANRKIWEKSQSDISVRGLGATLTAAFVHGNKLHVSQVGDSRAYLIRGAQIKQITEDQSWANAIKKAGIEPRDIPNNVILQALGTQPTLNAEVTSTFLCRGDYLLLCSDGLSNKVQDREMQSAVLSSPSLDDACRSLIDLANQRGGEDNITVVLACFNGNLLPTPDGTTVTDTFDIVPPSEPVADPPPARSKGNTGQLNRATAMMASVPSPDAAGHFHPHPPPSAAPAPPPAIHPHGQVPSGSAVPPTSPIGHKPAFPLKWVLVGILVFLLLGTAAASLVMIFRVRTPKSPEYGGQETPPSPKKTKDDAPAPSESEQCAKALVLVERTLDIIETAFEKGQIPANSDKWKKCESHRADLRRRRAVLKEDIESTEKSPEEKRADADSSRSAVEKIRADLEKMQIPGDRSEGDPPATAPKPSQAKPKQGQSNNERDSVPDTINRGVKDIKKLPSDVVNDDED